MIALIGTIGPGQPVQIADVIFLVARVRIVMCTEHVIAIMDTEVQSVTCVKHGFTRIIIRSVKVVFVTEIQQLDVMMMVIVNAIHTLLGLDVKMWSMAITNQGTLLCHVIVMKMEQKGKMFFVHFAFFVNPGG
jgi:hypothetical protein